MDSILNTCKKIIGYESDDTSFDDEITLYINSVLAGLNQMGVGPPEGFEVTSEDDVWDDFIAPGPPLGFLKAYVTQKVRMQFDPPANSTLANAIVQSIAENEWRLTLPYV